jgi:hypothetical protein
MTPTTFICNDPYGALDLINGGFARVGGTYGQNVQYERCHLLPRWLPDNPNSGWAWIFS